LTPLLASLTNTSQIASNCIATIAGLQLLGMQCCDPTHPAAAYHAYKLHKYGNKPAEIIDAQQAWHQAP
jgi:hypothetical protein